MIGKNYLGMLDADESFRFRFNYFRYRLAEDIEEKDWKEYIGSVYDSFGAFVSLGFVFAISPEGYEYWDKIRVSERDGVKYIEPTLKVKSLALRLESDEDVESPTERLEDVLKELNIKKQTNTMVKLQLDINPFLCKIDVSAKIDKVEERDEILYSPFEYPQKTYASLGDRVFCISIDYTDALSIIVTDYDDDSVQPFKLRITK